MSEKRKRGISKDQIVEDHDEMWPASGGVRNQYGHFEVNRPKPHEVSKSGPQKVSRKKK